MTSLKIYKPWLKATNNKDIWNSKGIPKLLNTLELRYGHHMPPTESIDQKSNTATAGGPQAAILKVTYQ